MYNNYNHLLFNQTGQSNSVSRVSQHTLSISEVTCEEGIGLSIRRTGDDEH